MDDIHDDLPDRIAPDRSARPGKGRDENRNLTHVLEATIHGSRGTLG
jgi:hypothetical protein